MLDDETDQNWIASLLEQRMREDKSQKRWLLDSVRKEKQITHVRERIFATLIHVHLTAPENVLRERFEARQKSGGEYSKSSDYESVKASPTEIAVRELSNIADLVIHTDVKLPNQSSEEIMGRVALVEKR